MDDITILDAAWAEAERDLDALKAGRTAALKDFMARRPVSFTQLGTDAASCAWRLGYWERLAKLVARSLEPKATTHVLPEGFGLPYAQAGVHDGMANVTCPVCGEVFVGHDHKEAGAAYGEHFTKEASEGR